MNTEARSSIDNLLTTLKERLAQPGQSLLPLLTSMSRFTRYSLSNQLLIFAQCPDATHVQGYRAWNKAGYQVRKGEHGIAIYAPMRFAQRDSDALDDGATATPRLGFRVAYVFDISQIDAQPGAAVHLPGTDTSAFATDFADSRTAERLTAAIDTVRTWEAGASAPLTPGDQPAAWRQRFMPTDFIGLFSVLAAA